MTTKQCDLATKVASMGRWVQCGHPRLLAWDISGALRDCPDCAGTGKVWEYALGEAVRVPCVLPGSHRPCILTGYATEHMSPAEHKRLQGRCPNCLSLGWTASTSLEDLQVAVFKKWPNAHIERMHGNTKFLPDCGVNTGVPTYGRWHVSISLWDCVYQALEEGYTVHPDVEKVRMP